MLGNILKIIRIANDNMSVKDAASKMGVSSSYITEIENGNKTPSLNTLRKFSIVYNIPVSRIVGLDEQEEDEKMSYQELLRNVLQYYISLRGELIAQESVEKKHSTI